MTDLLQIVLLLHRLLPVNEFSLLLLTVQHSTRHDADASRLTYDRPFRSTVLPEPDVTQVHTITEQYTRAMNGISVVNSMDSIDHYSDISQKSREDEERDRSYESLDQKSIQEVITRQPDIYVELVTTYNV